MYPKTHILFNLLIVILIKFIASLTLMQALIIFASSILIDIDHYFYYVGNAIISEHPKNLRGFFGIFKKRNLNPFKAYSWFIERDKQIHKLSKKEREKYKSPIMLFHGIEFWILLLILSFYSKIYIFLLIGIAIHMILDYTGLFVRKERFYIKFSQVYAYLKNKNKREVY